MFLGGGCFIFTEQRNYPLGISFFENALCTTLEHGEEYIMELLWVWLISVLL